MDLLKIGDKSFKSRLFTGTGKFASNEEMKLSLEASESGISNGGFKACRFTKRR